MAELVEGQRYIFPNSRMMFAEFARPSQLKGFENQMPKFGGRVLFPKTEMIYAMLPAGENEPAGTGDEVFSAAKRRYRAGIALEDGDETEYESSHGHWLFSAKSNAFTKDGRPNNFCKIRLPDGTKTFAGDPEHLDAIADSCYSGAIMTVVATFLIFREGAVSKGFFGLDGVSATGRGEPLTAGGLSDDALDALPPSNPQLASPAAKLRLSPPPQPGYPHQQPGYPQQQPGYPQQQPGYPQPNKN